LKPPVIAIEKILALEPPCLRITVPDSWTDSNGHMNIRWYLVVFDDAGEDLHARVGLTPDFHGQHQTGTMDLEHHTHFVNEIMPGENVAVYARLVARSSKRLHYLMFLVNETKGKLAAIFECMNSFADLKIRKTAPFPPEILAKIDAWLERDAGLDWPPPVSGSMQA
jgi:acyl-CoA thioester hydrolase